MQNASKQDETVPNGVVKAESAPDIEKDAKRIGQPTSEHPHQAAGAYCFVQWEDGRNACPAHNHIENRREFRIASPNHGFNSDATYRTGPNHPKHDPATVLAQGSFSANDLERGRLVRLSPDALRMPEPYYVCWGRTTLDQPNARAFLNWLIATAKEV